MDRSKRRRKRRCAAFITFSLIGMEWVALWMVDFYIADRCPTILLVGIGVYVCRVSSVRVRDQPLHYLSTRGNKYDPCTNLKQQPQT